MERDIYGATPLRRAIRYRNALYTEILVSIGASVKKAADSDWLKNWFEKRMKDKVIIDAIALGKSRRGENWRKKLQTNYEATMYYAV